MERKLYRVTGPQYIGRTGMKVQERWRNHRAGEATEHHAIRKYGFEKEKES